MFPVHNSERPYALLQFTKVEVWMTETQLFSLHLGPWFTCLEGHRTNYRLAKQNDLMTLITYYIRWCNVVLCTSRIIYIRLQSVQRQRWTLVVSVDFILFYNSNCNSLTAKCKLMLKWVRKSAYYTINPLSPRLLGDVACLEKHIPKKNNQRSTTFLSIFIILVSMDR